MKEHVEESLKLLLNDIFSLYDRTSESLEKIRSLSAPVYSSVRTGFMMMEQDHAKAKELARDALKNLCDATEAAQAALNKLILLQTEVI